MSAHDIAVEVRKPVSQGGAMPVKTGNLRNSLEASKTGIPSADYQPDARERLRDPMGQITSTIGTLSIGERLYLGFRVVYAPVQELRYGFVRLAELKWPLFVERAATLAKRLYP